MTSLPAARHLARLVGTTDRRKALRVGAQIYINFMSLTRRSGWLQGHISKQAARDPTKADRALAPGPHLEAGRARPDQGRPRAGSRATSRSRPRATRPRPTARAARC